MRWAPSVCLDDVIDAPASQDFPALLADEIGDVLPELAGAVHGIEELLDERGFRVLLREVAAARLRAEGALEEVSDSAGERESFDALRTPLGADLIAAHAPHLLRVGLEEGEVELAAEAVDEEVFETLFRTELMNSRLDVAEADLRGAGETKFAERVAGEGDGVVEEAAQEVDAAAARAHQHDELRVGIGLRVGVQRLQGAMAVLIGDDSMAGALVRDGHQIEPPLHDAVRLREEAVAADVHAIALVTDGARDAADGVVGFEHDGADGWSALRRFATVRSFPERRSNSRAAVRPAGPAPMMMAVR